jgi:DNA polymerase-3 subunit delta'
MPLSPLVGHGEARQALARAAQNGRLPQSLLVHGPSGIGKERFGLWLAQLLVCTGDKTADEPCGNCGPCRWAERLEHPDIHWFFPLPRPEGAATPERLRAKLEEHRAAELQARRSDPLHVPQFERAATYFLASIQALQALAATRPATGRHKVFVVGDAEAMVPQESSHEAANAFLKLLEEPPTDTVLVLTSSKPGALLPTIRSRVLPLRLVPLAAGEVENFLLGAGIQPEQAVETAGLAEGAPGRALRLLPNAGGSSTAAARVARGRALLAAVLANGAAPRLEAAHAEAPSGGRGEFSETLDAFGGALRELLGVSAGEAPPAGPAEHIALLQRSVQQHRLHPLGIAEALSRVPRARDLAAGNVNPQLILAVLLREVQQALGVTYGRPAADAP